MDAQRAFRKQVLEQFGATGSVLDELFAYNQNVFDHTLLTSDVRLPLDDEPFIPCWQGYAEEAKTRGVWPTLKPRIVQFNFPIQAGISTAAEYQQAVRKGLLSEHTNGNQGLQLYQPDQLELVIYQTPAGKIPMLIAGQKADFVLILQALTCKNEPCPIPDSQGAAMIAGYNNWDRVWQLKAEFQRAHPAEFTEDLWSDEFRAIIPHKQRYQDKLILLSRAYYSGVTPEQIGLSAAEWTEKSLIIRQEHESAHYFTKRALGAMRNNMLDELLADYAGICKAAGKFRAAWFLAFVGLENYPNYRVGGRLQNYRGDPPLSDQAFTILQALVYQAACNLEVCDAKRRAEQPNTPNLLIPLTYLTLEELASKQAEELLWNHLP